MNMGQSITIKGELSGAEDLTLEGKVEGRINLPDNVLTVGTNAKLHAEIVAKAVIVLGQVIGNVTAKEKFELKAGGTVEGNLASPRIAMADGATFNGKIEMPTGKAAEAKPVVERPVERQPVPAAV
jgi:cytoskeletal protein CcmA (bactofilin family)